jgi:hypothetical protein
LPRFGGALLVGPQAAKSLSVSSRWCVYRNPALHKDFTKELGSIVWPEMKSDLLKHLGLRLSRAEIDPHVLIYAE